MRKKIVFITLLVSLWSTLALAKSNHLPFQLKDGFDLGLGIAANAQKVSTRVSGVTTQHEDFGAESIMGRLYFGYSYNLISWFNLGAEAYIQIEDLEAKMTQANASASSKLDTRFNFGLKAMPGLNIGDYARAFFAVGVDWTNFKYYTSTFAQLAGARESYYKTKPGLLLGGGLEVGLPYHFSLRVEYDHVTSQEWELIAVGTTSKFKSYSNQFVGSLAYHF